MTQQATGRIAVMTAPGELALRDYPVVAPAPGALVLRVMRSNVCGSEIHIWCGHHPSKKSGGLGHEMVGRVEQLGEGVTHDRAGEPIAIGDRIVSTYFIACRQCHLCQQGQFNLCANAYRYWSQQPEALPHYHATFATHYYIQPDQYYYRVPDAVSDRAASSANCALSQVYFGLDEGGAAPGETVVIQGAGGLGLNAAAVAHARGCRVIMIDAVESRLATSERFGAHERIGFDAYPTVEARVARVRELTGGLGADLVMEVAGVPAALTEGLQLLRMGGRIVTMGNVTPGRTIELDPAVLTRASLRIIPVIRYQPWYLRKSLDFIAQHRDDYPFDSLLDADFGIDQIEDALARSADRTVTRASIVISD